MTLSCQDILNELQARIRNIYLEPHCSGPHTKGGARLFHYTDASGLTGIFRSGTLWATNLAFLNDPRELSYGKAFCRECLEVRSRGSDSKMPNVFKSALEAIDRHADILFAYELQMASCLSTQGDLLSQWRAYANFGQGFSIGFDSHRLLHVLVRQCKDPESTMEPNFWPCRIVYGELDKKTLLEKIVTLTLEYHAQFRDTGIQPFEDVENTLGIYLAQGVACAAMAFKAPGFQEECEVRLTIANLMELATAKTHIAVQGRSQNGRFVTYREIDLREESGLLPITQIVVGPAMDFDRTRHALRAYLRTLGYTEDNGTMPEIIRSATDLAWTRTVGLAETDDAAP